MKTKEIKKVESKLSSLLQSPDRFTVLKDDWIKDSFTGLDWGPSSDDRMEFEDAVKYCSDNGGRLPEIHELNSLVDFTKREPAIYEVFKDTKTDDWYWSGTKTSWRTDAAWCVSFISGGVYGYFEFGDSYVRPVRSSQ